MATKGQMCVKQVCLLDDLSHGGQYRKPHCARLKRSWMVREGRLGGEEGGDLVGSAGMTQLVDPVWCVPLNCSAVFLSPL